MIVILSAVILFSDLRLLELSRVLSIVFLLTSASIAGTVTLAWDPNPEPDIVGYDVRYGTASGRYDQSVDVGNSTTATISNLTTGLGHFFLVIARNSADLSSPPSNEVFAVVGSSANQLPAVNLTSPADGAVLTRADTSTVSASADDSDGSITKVEFFEGNSKFGEDFSSPYTLTWSHIAGTYSLTARATDNAGAAADSSPVVVTIADPIVSPSSLVASPSIATNTLSWIDNSGNENGFVVECRLSGTQSWSLIATLPADSTQFVDSELA